MPQIRLPDGSVREVEMPAEEQAVPQRWAVLVDLDGTLSDHEKRLPFLPENPDDQDADWTDFYRNQLSDPPFVGVAEIIRRLRDMYVVIMTARPEKYRADSERWLQNNQINWDAMLMRAEGDHRPNMEVKKDQLELVLGLGWRPFIAFEDHPPTIDMLRAAGIETLSVSNNWEEFDGNDEATD